MQQEWWMQPALQKNEAVLLPALERSTRSTLHLLNRMTHIQPATESFLPVGSEWPLQTTALSTYVRPRGSMAGRSVLRAAGVRLSPYRSASKRTACMSRMLHRR